MCARHEKLNLIVCHILPNPLWTVLLVSKASGILFISVGKKVWGWPVTFEIVHPTNHNYVCMYYEVQRSGQKLFACTYKNTYQWVNLHKEESQSMVDKNTKLVQTLKLLAHSCCRYIYTYSMYYSSVHKLWKSGTLVKCTQLEDTRKYWSVMCYLTKLNACTGVFVTTNV